jgi:hypothetical protein
VGWLVGQLNGSGTWRSTDRQVGDGRKGLVDCGTWAGGYRRVLIYM